MHNFLYRYRSDYSFTTLEAKQLLLSSVAIAFILSFRKWGTDQFDLSTGLVHFILSLVVVFISLYLPLHIQKISGLNVGYFPSYRAYPSMLILGIVLCFLTNGYIPFFIPGCLTYTLQSRMRLGKLRTGYTLWEASLVSLSGPLTNLVIAAVLGMAYHFTSNETLYAIVVTNLLLAVYSMLPIPQFQRFNPIDLIFSQTHRFKTLFLHLQEGGPPGLHVFMHHRTFFVLTFSLTLFYAGLVLAAHLFTLTLALILSLFTTVFYYYLVEKS